LATWTIRPLATALRSPVRAESKIRSGWCWHAAVSSSRSPSRQSPDRT